MNPIYLLTSGGALVAFGPGLVLCTQNGSVVIGNTNGVSMWETVLCTPETLEASDVIFQFAYTMSVCPAGSVLRWDEDYDAVQVVAK
jgi:hypothetical protein